MSADPPDRVADHLATPAVPVATAPARPIASPPPAGQGPATLSAANGVARQHHEVDQTARGGGLPHPSEQKLPGSPLSADPYSPGALPLPRWVGVLAGACAILLVPWIFYLAVKLPEQARASHYDVVWVGFDIAMFAALAGLGWCAWRRSTYTEVMAAVTGTMLVTDAWFDVVTANDNTRRMEAFASALLIELPLAALCAWVAQNAERLRRRAYRQLWLLARVEGLLGPGSGPAAGPTADPAARPGSGPGNGTAPSNGGMTERAEPGDRRS